MHTIALCRWEHLSQEQRQAVAELRISEAQVEFCGAVEKAIALCQETDPELLRGVAFLFEGRVVGFCLVRRGAVAAPWVPADAVAITGLRMDMRVQGKGLGRQALLALPACVLAVWPGTARLVLSVDEHNPAGIAAYERAGWVDDGPRYQGRIGMERRMTKWLDAMTKDREQDEHHDAAIH